MNKFLLIAILLFSLLLVSCGEKLAESESSKEIITSSVNKETSESSHPSKKETLEELYRNEIKGYEKYKEGIFQKLNLDLKETEAMVTRQVEKGMLMNDIEATVVLFELMPYPGYPHTPVIVIDNGGKLTCKEVGNSGMYKSEFFLRDIDGDGLNEIIVRTSWATSGPFDGNETSIYKLEKNNINQLYIQNIDNRDTGFYLELGDGYRFTIKNKNTGFQKSFIKEPNEQNSHYFRFFFDENGKLTDHAKKYNNERNIIGGTFRVFDLVDIEGNGTYSLVAGQDDSFYDKGDSIGDFISVLKYDKAKKEMIVVKAGHHPPEYNTTDYNKWHEKYMTYLHKWCKE